LNSAGITRIFSVRQRILILDSDPAARSSLSDLLSRHEYDVLLAASGQQMDRIMAEVEVDLVILDIMVPDESGLSICGRLRNLAPAPGLMVVSAFAEESDIVVGLEIGADDYLAKPYRPRELLARARAVLRRRRAAERAGQSEDQSLVYRFNGWRLSVATHQLLDPFGGTVDLSSAEFTLLWTLVSRPQQILTREQLMQGPRGGELRGGSQQVNVTMSRLRAKLSHVEGGPQLIRTVRYEGYVLAASVERVAAG
jgi:two-component system OmpR family response regulator